MKQQRLRVYLTMAVVAPLLVLAEAWPWHPHTGLGWLVLVVFAVPLCALAAGLEKAIDADPLAARIDVATKEKPLSGLRIAYLLFRTILICAVATGAALMILRLWLRAHTL
jgi:hypothetical protein